jgi:hypothetical protein
MVDLDLHGVDALLGADDLLNRSVLKLVSA